VLGQFVTGSWVGRAFQGRGIGREMRAAALHLGFAGLGATRALTDAFADNAASLAVTRSLGYRPAGRHWMTRRGEPAEQLRFVMDRADWDARRRSDIEIDGVGDDLRGFLGLC
jgi:RimJ/RimL family protein N-acetyltransferase